MVSNASELLPEPDTPVITVKEPRGISTLMFFKLCCLAPVMRMMDRGFKRKPPFDHFLRFQHDSGRLYETSISLWLHSVERKQYVEIIQTGQKSLKL